MGDDVQKPFMQASGAEDQHVLTKDEVKAIAKRMIAINPPSEATYWHNQRATARWLASTLFMGKTWGMYDYTHHLEQVATLQNDDKLKTIAWLHDLIEDIDGWELDDLREIGFHEDVVLAVDALTKREAAGEKYFEAVARCGMNEYAPKVKMADNTCNSQLIEYHRFPTQRQHDRSDKYWVSFHYLKDVDTGIIPRGTPVLLWAIDNESRLLNPDGGSDDIMPEDKARLYDLLMRETDDAAKQHVRDVLKTRRGNAPDLVV